MNRLVLALGVLVGVGSAVAQGPPPARVRFDVVRQESVERQRQVTGQLRASRAARVASREEGRVIEILVDIGDTVTTGQPMVRLDDTLLRLQLVELDANLEALERSVEEVKALADQAALEVARREHAVREGGVSATELEDSRIAQAAAVARAARAEAAVASARALRARTLQRIEDMDVCAPFPGSVVTKLVEAGEWIDQGNAIAEIVQLDPIDAWLEVPEGYIDDLERSSGLTVMVPSVNASVESVAVAIVDRASELARTFPVRVRLANASGLLRPGMSANADVPTGDSETVLTIRKDALLRDDAGTFVFFDAGGMAMAARVERLWGVGDRVVVRSGTLRPGMRVVVEGNERMFPMQPLVDIDAPPPATTDAGGAGAEGR